MVKNRFAKPKQLEEDLDFDLEAFLLPITSRKTEII